MLIGRVTNRKKKKENTILDGPGVWVWDFHLEVSSSKSLVSKSKGFAFWIEVVALGLPSAVTSST